MYENSGLSDWKGCCFFVYPTYSIITLECAAQFYYNFRQYYKNNSIRLKVIDLPTDTMELPEGQEWFFEIGSNILVGFVTIVGQEGANIRQRQAESIEAQRPPWKRQIQREPASTSWSV